ncbi:hypothetical protein D3C80_1200940 [compost metagenome]
MPPCRLWKAPRAASTGFAPLTVAPRAIVKSPRVAISMPPGAEAATPETAPPAASLWFAAMVRARLLATLTPSARAASRSMAFPALVSQ